MAAISPNNSGGRSSDGHPTEMSAFEEDNDVVPKATQNRLAMALGKYLQGPIVAIALYAVSCTAVIGAGASLVGVSAEDALVMGSGLVASGVLSATLTWVVQNSPYDMLETLRDTILSMRRVGRHMSGEVARLSSENAELAETRSRMNEEIEEAAMVRRGMQQTLNTLLSDIGNRHSELHSITGEVAAEVQKLGEVSDSMMNRFLSTITGMDRQVKRAELLAKELEATTRANSTLSMRMLEITGKLEESLAELQDVQFAESVQKLVVQIDALGDDGMRDRLRQKERLEPEQAEALFNLLTTLDRVLREELEAKQNRCKGLLETSRQCIAKNVFASVETVV